MTFLKSAFASLDLTFVHIQKQIKAKQESIIKLYSKVEGATYDIQRDEKIKLLHHREMLDWYPDSGITKLCRRDTKRHIHLIFFFLPTLNVKKEGLFNNRQDF